MSSAPSPKLLANVQAAKCKFASFLFKLLLKFPYFHSKKEDWNAMVRKSTKHRNPIGSASEAAERQRNRSLRRKIMEVSSSDGLAMSTDVLLEFNPKLADVSHHTRVAYAKFMTTKLKKEIKFEDDQVKVENEITRARETKAFNKFRTNAGILKKPREKAAEVKDDSEAHSSTQMPPVKTITPDEPEAKDFRSRTPIQEDPREGMQTPDRPSTPENILDEPVPQISTSPIPTPSPALNNNPSPSPVPPAASDTRKNDSPIEEPKSQLESSESTVKSSEPPTIKTPDDLKTDEEDETEEKPAEKPKKDNTRLNVPTTSNRPSSPTPSINTGDKGKSKITGKTLTGWI